MFIYYRHIYFHKRRITLSKSYSPRSKTLNIMIAAVLTAIGILIPMVMPIRIIIGPASYTLGSHIPIIMAMFISPMVALAVAIGTTLGFLMAAFPIVIVLRAFSHIIFASIGAWVLQNTNGMFANVAKRQLFNFSINVIHALAEVIVVFILTGVGQENLDTSFWYVLLVLVGVGTIIHGMVDFELGYQFSRMLTSRTNLDFANLAKNTQRQV